MTRGSYLLIEPGMIVHGADGNTIGTVEELVADENADIFRGIVLNRANGFLSQDIVFVPGEHVTAVEGQTVSTDLTDKIVAQLKATDFPSSTANEQTDTTSLL
jgi:sporulation protein YlmC with PRC-barrel domain